MAARKGKKSSSAARRPAAAAQADVIEEVDEGGGVTLDSGIVYATTVSLVIALVLMIMAGQIYSQQV